MAYQKYKEESYNNSGGINVKISEYNTAVTEVLDLRNYTFIRPGKWTSRPGVQVSYSLPISTFTLTPRSNIQYTKDSGESYQLFDSGQTLFLRDTNVAVSGSLISGTSVLPIDYVVQNNYLYYANGYAFKRYDATNELNWNIGDGFSGIAQFNKSFTGGSAGVTFNISLTPFNGNTVILSALDYTGVQYSIAGFRNSYTLQTVATKYKTFKNDWAFTLLMSAIPDFNGNGFSLPGAPTFVGKGQWVIYGFTMRPQLGVSSVIIQKPITYGITQAYVFSSGPAAGRDLQFATDVQYSVPVSFSSSFFVGASNTEAVSFDHFSSSQDYRFQTALYLRPKYLQTYNNMLFMANIIGQTIAPVSSDKPSTVYFSNLATPEQVDEENFLEVRTGNGDVITGMCNYQTHLLIFKQYSVHEVSGSSPEALTLNDLSLEFGCVNNRAVVSFENLCWFVDPTGIIEYNGSSFNDISSDKIKPFLDQVDKTNMSAVHIKKNNQVVFSASHKSFVYDYVAKAWSIFDNLAIDQNAGPAYFAYGASVRDLTYWQAGQSFQQSVRFNDQLTTDFGLPITLAIKTRYHKRLGESTQELWRRFFLNTTSSGTSMNAVTLNMYPDYGTSIYLQRNFTISSFQQRIDYGISAKSLSIEILIQSSQSLSVNGYTVESRYLRSV